METTIRRAIKSDAAQLVELRRTLFAETSALMWEPGEFVATAADESLCIARVTSRSNSLLLVALDGGRVIGFLAIIGGERKRTKHSAHLALGILREHWSKGIASRMLAQVVAWSPSAGIKRLELTVHTTNARAVSLYQRHGF